jgi:hypothetical protein
MFTRNLLILCICIAMSAPTYAQDAHREYVEQDGWGIGTSIGLSDLWGDIGTKSFLQHYTNSKYFDKVAFMGGLFGRYSIHPCLGVRLSTNFGTLYATDKWNYDLATKAESEGDDGYQRYARAQNVKAYTFEGSVIMELLPFRINPESKRADKRGQPFIGLGLGVFHFQPYSTVGADETWVKIYDLRLEGQGWGGEYPKQFKLWQVEIPIVIGYRWDIGEHLNFGVEYHYRYTFTDYLDGVSGKYVGASEYAKHMSPRQAQTAAYVADKGYYAGLEQPNQAGNLRGNPGNKDAYSTLALTIYYKVPTRSPKWYR